MSKCVVQNISANDFVKYINALPNSQNRKMRIAFQNRWCLNEFQSFPLQAEYQIQCVSIYQNRALYRTTVQISSIDKINALGPGKKIRPKLVNKKRNPNDVLKE